MFHFYFYFFFSYYKENNVELVSAHAKSDQISANMAAESVLAEQVDVWTGSNLLGAILYGGLRGDHRAKRDYDDDDGIELA